MTNVLKSAGLALAATSLLAGCSGMYFAEVDEPSIAVTRKLNRQLPGAPGVGAVNVVTPIPLPGIPEIDFDTGEFPLAKQEKDGNVKTVINLNGGAIEMLSATGDLDSIAEAKLLIYNKSTDPTGLQKKVLAIYTRDPAVPAGKKLTFVKGPDDLNLVDYLVARHVTLQLTMTVQGTVTLPQQNWDANLILDFHVKSRAEFP